MALPLAVAFAPAVTMAANGVDDDTPPPDARLEGFAKDNQTAPLLIADQHGNAGTWFLLAIAGAVCFGVMAKNAKRTHLD